ncbi:MAG: 3-hydroxybutyryl-CoA dehydrogenase [Chloroflexi bacterium]|nr:3-hydroxybutyryl-CoA dehydrogenase [Chloroflexota bacterium]
MTINTLVLGDPPFADALAALCRKSGSRVIVADLEEVADGVSDNADAYIADIIVDCTHRPDKIQSLTMLEMLVRPSALILTSALTASVSSIAADMGDPGRVVGFAVIPPLKKGDVVEVARGLRTSDKAYKAALGFWRGLGLVPVEVGDGPGLVRGRVLACLVNEAVSALHERVASAGDIDTAMKLGTNYPRGPLEWAEYLGVETIYGVMTGLYNEWLEDRYRPHPLLSRMAWSNRNVFAD